MKGDQIMKRMKFLALLMIAVMIVTGLSACATPGSKDQEASNQTSTPTSTPEPETKPSETTQ